jgi:hypothetical protein
LSSIPYYVLVLYYVTVNSKTTKEVPLDDYVDELLNGGGEVNKMGLDGKQLNFMCNMDAPHPSLRTNN